MTTDEWNALLNKLTEAWEKRAKEKAMFVPHYKKNQYLKNYTPRYKAERRIQKHLPYQRRNY